MDPPQTAPQPASQPTTEAPPQYRLEDTVVAAIQTIDSSVPYDNTFKELNVVHPRVSKLLSRDRIPQHTDEWHARRKLLITATNVASILGQNPYETSDRLFKKKTGQIPPEKSNPACQFGTRYESEAAAVYQAVTGNELVEEDIGLVVHPTLLDFGASPDRVCKFYPILIEIKVPFRRQIHEHQIPPYYIPQVQMQVS